MTERNRLSEEELEELAYKVICWMKKWVLWDSVMIFSRGKAFSSFPDGLGMAGRKQAGWRDWEDVWVWSYGPKELRKVFLDDFVHDLDRYALTIECGERLADLFTVGIYAADFDSLPDAAQVCLLRHMALFESCEDWWYSIYLEEGVRFDDTEFDSFDEYWELESDNQEEFKLELLKECLSSPRDSNSYNEEVAKLVLGELDEILGPYHLQTDSCFDGLIHIG